MCAILRRWHQLYLPITSANRTEGGTEGGCDHERACALRTALAGSEGCSKLTKAPLQLAFVIISKWAPSDMRATSVFSGNPWHTGPEY